MEVGGAQGVGGRGCGDLGARAAGPRGRRGRFREQLRTGLDDSSRVELLGVERGGGLRGVHLAADLAAILHKLPILLYSCARLLPRGVHLAAMFCSGYARRCATVTATGRMGARAETSRL